MPNDDEMDSSYGGKPAAVAPPEEGGDEPADNKTESVDEENSTEQTAIISNKILSPEGEPINAGDEIVLQVVKNYGDESEVKYAPHKSGEGAEEPETAGAASDFAAMSEEKA